MKKHLPAILLAVLPLFAALSAQDFSVRALTCEHRTNPLGLDALEPRFSWKTFTERRGWRQSAWQIQVATDPGFAPAALVWDSGKTDSDASVLQTYAGAPLRSGTRYLWKVKVWDEQGRASDWSRNAFWETALLSPEDWKAQWIEPENAPEPPRYQPAQLLRKTFRAEKTIASARAYATARGLYELWVNGKRAGDDLLAPGWTNYPKRLQYQTYDLTDLLQKAPGSENAIGAMLGEGWFRSGLGWEKNWAFYGKKLAFLCQIHLRYADGSEEWLLSDGSWRASDTGPVRKNEIYYGEDFDARLASDAWCSPGFDDSKWWPAQVADYPKTNLLAAASVPVRRIREIAPVKIFKTPGGDFVADMGQNMVGWVRLKVKGKKGKTVTLRHAEVLDKDGNFYTANLRTAKQQIRYTLGGDKTGEVYEPRFTFMGFRYVAIEGWPGGGAKVSPGDLTGIVVHSDMPTAGAFECSSPLVNQLYSNIQWGQRGNFVDVPTDCPQRDERMGWTGDAQAFARAATFNMDVSAFFAKWLQDLAAEQRPSGAVPFVVPNVLDRPDSLKIGSSAGWADAATIIPWTMYEVYADRRLLARQYPSMKKWVDFIRSQAGDSLLWRGGSVFGDWLFYHPERTHLDFHTSPDAYTNHDFIATAFFAHSADLTARAAAALGYREDAFFYKKLFEKVRAAFVREFITASGRTVSGNSQTSYVLALQFGLMPDSLRTAAVGHLAKDIRSKKNHLSTGFLGTPYLCHVLSENGETELAYDLLLQETYPSWLYPVKMGATTIWERWDGQKTDSTFQDVGMNSFNHYAYGAIGDWLFQTVAGIRLDAPEKPRGFSEAAEIGYKHFVIEPHPTPKLAHARATYESNYGEIASGWERRGERTVLRVRIPPNTTAAVRLPVEGAAAVRESGKGLGDAPGVRIVGTEAGRLVLEVGAGTYLFEF